MAEYFKQFSDFDHQAETSLLDEFGRLAITMDWERGGIRYQKEKKECLRAGLLDILDNSQTASRLQTMQTLCQELSIDPVPPTITQCRKVSAKRDYLHELNWQALSSVCVNLVDLIDARRSGTRPHIFANKAALRSYTKRTGRYFPRTIAKSDDGLKHLLCLITGNG